VQNRRERGMRRIIAREEGVVINIMERDDTGQETVNGGARDIATAARRCTPLFDALVMRRGYEIERKRCVQLAAGCGEVARAKSMAERCVAGDTREREVMSQRTSMTSV